MRAIRLSLAAALLGLTVLWLLAEAPGWPPVGFFALRDALVQGTGVIAIGAMSLGLVLAARPALVEPWLGGLDKMYRLHKWLGITALVAGVLHWGWSQAPKWAVGLGWMARRVRVRAEAQPVDTLEGWLHSQRGLAESAGEWAFYAAVLLVGLALIKRFPYHLFVKTHRLLAVAYLVLVAHAVVLLRFGHWASLLGVVMAVLMAAGTVAAVFILLGKVGLSRQAVGEVVRADAQPALQVLEVTIQLRSRWRGHRAGQFAFIGFGDGEGPHPFTIVSPVDDSGRLTVLIKALGDYTGRLQQHLSPGTPVTLEGPYGQFDFDGEAPRQVWVAGGIGITPFIARMKALALNGDGRRIDLFHSTAVTDARSEARLHEDARASGVRLHLQLDGRDPRLSVQRICEQVPDWAEADVWFCGPTGFGRAMRQGFRARGLAAGRFHQELFEMR